MVKKLKIDSSSINQDLSTDEVSKTQREVGGGVVKYAT